MHDLYTYGKGVGTYTFPLESHMPPLLYNFQIIIVMSTINPIQQFF